MCLDVDTITALLNISTHRIARIAEYQEDRACFVLEARGGVEPICSGCGKGHAGLEHSKETVVVEDVGLCGRRVFLQVVKRKLRCPADGRIRVEKLAWIRERFTKRFAEQITRLTAITTNQEAGWYLGLDDEKVYRIDRKMLEEGAREKLDPVPAPTHMSVDELAWQKWHRYVTNVVDIDKRKVIWNEDGRGKEVLDRFYKVLGKENSKNIEAVASDGARGYLSSTKEHAPQALIVLDHFHVKKYLNDAVDTVRKQELHTAREQNNKELSALLHCNKRFILMQNTVTNKKRDLLEKLAQLNQGVYQALLLKEQFLSIYTAGDRSTAWANLKAWIVAALRCGLPSFEELGRKFFRKRHYVLNYFICKITTAISEGINNKIKRLMRMAYGYRDVKYFLLKIHQHCGLLNPRLST
jgi:transposase